MFSVALYAVFAFAKVQQNLHDQLDKFRIVRSLSNVLLLVQNEKSCVSFAVIK